MKIEKKLSSVTRLKVLLRKKVEKEKPTRCSERSFPKLKFATSKRIFLVFYFLLNECDINRLLPAH